MLNQFFREPSCCLASRAWSACTTRVAVFGIGGVGGYGRKRLARSGVRALDLIDDDKVCLTNNQSDHRYPQDGRSIQGRGRRRGIHDINPDCKGQRLQKPFTRLRPLLSSISQYDYVVDAIDTVIGKLELIEQATKAGTRIISCMGAGNKIHADKLEVTDIYKTSGCPLARVMRYELRKRRIRKLKVVYSKEPAMTPIDDMAIGCRQNCICPRAPREKMHPAPTGSGQHCVCACCCRVLSSQAKLLRT